MSRRSPATWPARVAFAAGLALGATPATVAAQDEGGDPLPEDCPAGSTTFMTESGEQTCVPSMPPIGGPGECAVGYDRDENTGICKPVHIAPPPPPPPTPPPPPGGGSSPGGNTNTAAPPSPPTLVCGAGARGSQIQCRVEAEDGVSVTDVTWSFGAFGSSNRDVSDAKVPGHTNWVGFATESGTVEADVKYSQGETTGEESLSTPVTVSDRGWIWPDVENGGDAGADLDDCYGTTDWGLTEGPSGCDAQFFDPTAAEVKEGTGPWGLGYYVRERLEASEPAVRWSLAPVLRKDAGLRYPTATLPADVRRNCGDLASVYEVNMTCSKNTGDDYDASADFNGLVAAVTAHEAEHVKAVTAEAAKPENDLHEIWDRLVGSDATEVATEAINRANAVLNALQQASLATHGANPITPHSIWRYDGRTWRRKSTP